MLNDVVVRKLIILIFFEKGIVVHFGVNPIAGNALLFGLKAALNRKAAQAKAQPRAYTDS